jgi:hypothetical protein
MHQRETFTSESETGRGEIAAAVERLAREVSRVVLQVKFASAIAAAKDVQRVMQAYNPVIAISSESNQRRLSSELTYLEPADQSVQPKSAAPSDNCEKANHRSEASDDCINQRNGGDSEIAAHILKLHERLGGFIAP